MASGSNADDRQATLTPKGEKYTNNHFARSAYFPLGYKAAASQWWSCVTPAIAERKVISFIPFGQNESGSEPTNSSDPAQKPSEPKNTKDPYGLRAWNSRIVTLSGADRYLNEFSVERVGEDVEQNLVMLHGYGAGLGFFYKNFEGLSRVKGWKIYALDMLGMGRSSRPPFKINAKDQAGKIKEAENWFTDSLEEWRVLKKIEKFTLLGHSMGGYMAVAYALKYPGRIKKLILASPVGIPEDPNAVHEGISEQTNSALAQEFAQSQNETTKSKSSSMGDSNVKNKIQTESSGLSDKKELNNPPRPKLPKWLVYLWDANVSPFSVIRWTGPLGPRFVSGWSSRRFSHLPSDESEALHQYAYSLFRQRGSGEYALSYILAPGAFARNPLINRIHMVGRQDICVKDEDNKTTSSLVSQTSVKETGIPIIIMYGENDWMDIAGGYEAKQKLEEEKCRVLKISKEEERLKENGSTKVLIVKKAGHHLYLDGWEEFNQMIREEMELTTTQEKPYQPNLG